MDDQQAVVPVSRLLDERGLGSFQIVLIAWSFLLTLIDGYDIAAIAFAAPYLVREWGISPTALGPVFSASLVGILFGSAIFGWVGDRYGRKAALVASNVVFGLFTLAAAYATNLDQMFWLRRHQRGIRTAPAARDTRHHRRRFGAARRSHSGLRHGRAGATARLADHLPDRRHRAARHRARGRVRAAGVDQVHGLA
jgi:hypothetical protein